MPAARSHGARLVAVSQRVDACKDRGETRDALDQALASWLIAAGLLPVPVPNALEGAGLLASWLDGLKPAAMVLSGGNDLGLVRARDATEASLLDYARTRRMPVLGICRGLQMMAVHAGANLKQVTDHVNVRHRVFHDRAGTGVEVNSFHAFGIESCPPDYEVSARSADGEIEALTHTELPWEGWMWHPERERVFHEAHLARARALLSVPRTQRAFGTASRTGRA